MTEPCPFGPRKQEVLSLLADGKTAIEISMIMGISRNTVISHIALMREAANASNSTSLVAKSLRQGWIN